MGLEIYTNDAGVWWDVRSGELSICAERPFPLNPGSIELVPWRSVREVALLDPWPTFRLTYANYRGEEAQRAFHPKSLHRIWQFTPSLTDQLGFEQVVLTAYGVVAERARDAVANPGWSEYPVVEWDRLGQLPEFLSEGPGAYRSAASPIIARRPPPGPLGAVRAWLRASPDMQWGETAKEILLTADTLYVRQWDNEYWALPRNTLRHRFFHAGRHATYIFGRRGFLVLRYRKGCEVMRALNAQLGH